MMIIIVILLIALVVIVIIFSGKTSIFAKTTSGCASQGGICLPACPPTHAPLTSASCDSGVCCIPLYNTPTPAAGTQTT